MFLTESPESIETWKAKILGALGSNGKVVTDVIPELEFIIGEQPPVAELGSQENSNRFYLVFQNFIKVFANFEHPLSLLIYRILSINSWVMEILLDSKESKRKETKVVFGFSPKDFT